MAEYKALLIKPAKGVIAAFEDTKAKVLQVHDCLEGLRALVRHRPDFVVVQADLPGLSGLSLARIAHLLQLPTPFLLTSPAPDTKADRIAASLPNAKNILLEGAFFYDLKHFLAAHDKARSRGEREEHPPREVNFLEHEWAALLGEHDRQRVLILEPDALTRRALAIKLDASMDCQLFSASDGLEGLAKALFINPDLILSEVDLPTLGGMHLAQIFNILGKPFPLVFVTAEESLEVQKKASQIPGVIGLIHKSRLPRKGFLIMAMRQFLARARPAAKPSGPPQPNPNPASPRPLVAAPPSAKD